MTVIIKYDIAPLFIIFFVVLLLLGMFSYILTLPLKFVWFLLSFLLPSPPELPQNGVIENCSKADDGPQGRKPPYTSSTGVL